jgi:ATP-dependent helicase HrpB
VTILPTVLASGSGDVLCFLPGAGEIERALQDARGIGERHDLDLLPLHGSLGADAQDRALLPGARRRVVMATNIAETSLTVPGVSLVVDGGWQKVARYDAERAIDTLVLERVTADSAAQRAGRAARLGPGRAWRLWDARDRLRPARELEVDRVDLAGVVLGLMAAGSAPERFRWFEAPSLERVQAARELLERLGAIQGTRVTALGHQLRRLPLHPRLACVLIAAGGAWEAAAACALLSEIRPAAAVAAATTCDLLPLIDRWASVPPHTRQVARPSTASDAAFSARRLETTSTRRISAGPCSPDSPTAWRDAARTTGRRWCWPRDAARRWAASPRWRRGSGSSRWI